MVKSIMKKISRIEAFYEVTRTLERGENNKAEEMFKVITDSIVYDKKNNTFSEYITLRGKRQEQLFKDILINEQEC